MEKAGRLLRVATVLLIAVGIAGVCSAQTVRGVVVDQTALPLPGVVVEVLENEVVIGSVTTGADGTFVIDEGIRGGTIALSLEGFEPTRVPRADAARIVLSIAHATETSTVVAPSVTESSPTAPLLGNTLTATNISRLPSARMQARESLPLLPSVVRGPDGLMQLGGARAHDTPLFLDGFNVTDPATGISSLNLPFEAVRGIDVLRDPMSVNYGGLLGGMVKMESRPGGDAFSMGLQGFIPRPRFASPGFGRLEGIFPRVFANGSAASGRLKYFVAAEYDYERIPVPNVTAQSGSDIVEHSSVSFVRLDAQVSPRHGLTLEAFVFPSGTNSFGLSPRRDQQATADVSGRDLFAGLTHRFLASRKSTLTLQFGAMAHEATLAPHGTDVSYLSPAGWQGNWFADVRRTATRYSASAVWERIGSLGGRMHDFMISGEVAVRQLRGHVAERPIVVQHADGSVMRTVEFGPSSAIAAADRPGGLALRDVWHVTERMDVEGGLRMDHSRYGGVAPSGRAGLRYALAEDGSTIVKAGYGKFVGALPLAVPAFGGYPQRVERWFEAACGETLRQATLQPTVGRLRLPHALAATLSLEQRLLFGLEAQIAMTLRRSRRLATLHVPMQSGPLSVESTGSGNYREVQLSIRRTWEHDQQLFVSYVRSSARGELNDFATAFQVLDSPLLQSGGMSRLPGDARHRVVAWGTFNLPHRVVVSPVTEWRSGFPYSALDPRYVYAGSPNSRSYPSFLATDMVVYKTFTVRKRSADVGVQLFNVTNHRNPRDVYAVIGAPRSGEFTNSVGPILRGYMLLKW